MVADIDDFRFGVIQYGEGIAFSTSTFDSSKGLKAQEILNCGNEGIPNKRNGIGPD